MNVTINYQVSNLPNFIFHEIRVEQDTIWKKKTKNGYNIMVTILLRTLVYFVYNMDT